MRTFRHLGDPHGGNDPAEAIDAAWATATGPRPDNQDLADATPRWAVVSDGAGGLPGGATDNVTVAVVRHRRGAGTA
jgi:hypothetical protein